jgi:hypothetical protein
MGVWVDSRAGLDVLEKKNISYPVWVGRTTFFGVRPVYLQNYVPMINLVKKYM